MDFYVNGGFLMGRINGRRGADNIFVMVSKSEDGILIFLEVRSSQIDQEFEIFSYSFCVEIQRNTPTISRQNDTHQ